jgi:glucose/arabinose dehydrogenase
VTTARTTRSTLRLAALIAVLAAALAAPAVTHAGTPLGLQLVKSGLNSPMFLTHAFDDRLFVVERGGTIKIIHSNDTVTTFLDISEKVRTDGERGLLSLAFHPDYATNRLFYVVYNRASDGDIIIAEYKRNATDPDAANAGSERILLRIEHSSASNHNGGWSAFKGSNLYVSVGDGASSPANAQDKDSLLGKILRINPLDPPGAQKYSIPDGNPYVGRSGRDEVFARGLRNPWRCSFDRLTGRLWCNDVGENVWEEIDRTDTGKGVNFGWPIMEGRHPRGTSDPCASSCKTLPIAEYSHNYNESTGGSSCTSTTGGYVSRRAGAALYGNYVFGDFCSGLVWIIPENFTAGSALPAPADDTNLSISSFGEDFAGHIYLVDLNGSVYRLTDS